MSLKLYGSVGLIHWSAGGIKLSGGGAAWWVTTRALLAFRGEQRQPRTKRREERLWRGWTGANLQIVWFGLNGKMPLRDRV